MPAFTVSFLISLLFARPLMALLKKWELFDIPNHRSMHHKKVLRMGGVLFLSGYFGSVIFLYFTDSFFQQQLQQREHIAFLVGVVSITLLGGLDDHRNLGARLKLLIEILIAGLLCWSGVLIEEFHLFGIPVSFGMLAVPVTMFWIVGIINAVNLIDGLDGLAGGIAMIIFCTLFAMHPHGDSFESILNLSLMGALLIFLRYNVHPAKVFMGDLGSLFLGYHIAVFSLTMAEFKTATLGILIPVFLLGLPVLDTAAAIFRRARLRNKIFQADKEHIHHQLIKIGFSHRQVVHLLWAISTALAVIAYIGSRAGTHMSGVLLFGAAIFFCIFILVIKEFKAIRAKVYAEGFENGIRAVASRVLANEMTQEELEDESPEQLLSLIEKNQKEPAKTTEGVINVTANEVQWEPRPIPDKPEIHCCRG